VLDIDTNHLDWFTPRELLNMLIDVSPDISAAAWQFQRMCNPGFECRVYELGSDTVESSEGSQYVSTFFERLRQLYGSMDIVLGRYFMGAFLAGAFVSEIVLDQNFDSIDLVAPDPEYIRFRKRKDPIRGEVWEPGQWQDGKFVSLDLPTFRYLPVDPVPASPYGRALAAPALFTAIFILSLLHDIKRVIMQQGYKRMDIELNTEMAFDNFNYDSQGNDNFGSYVYSAINQVKNIYRTLQPDDAFIHTDMFSVNTPTGTIDLDSIGAVDKIMERLERQITRALKSNGVVMDTSNNTNESDSNRKWEIYAAGIKSLQHHCENMMESQLQVGMQAKGIQGRVMFRFAELRASEMLRDEQAQAMRTQNARNNYEAGFVSQDEASNYAVNHNADQPEPRKAVEPLDLVKDDNSGNEELDKQNEDRSTKIDNWPVKPVAISEE
jgi:hypothetical protein